MRSESTVFGKAAREDPERAFEAVGVFLFELRLPLALSTKHQRVVLDTDVDIVLFQSRDLGTDDQVVPGAASGVPAFFRPRLSRPKHRTTGGDSTAVVC